MSIIVEVNLVSRILIFFFSSSSFEPIYVRQRNNNNNNEKTRSISKAAAILWANIKTGSQPAAAFSMLTFDVIWSVFFSKFFFRLN